MKILLSALVAVCTLTLTAARAEAIPFDFTLVGAAGDLNVTSLTTTAANGGVTATGYVRTSTSTSTYILADLWLRNNTGDKGLGVCSEGHSSCASGGGDVNELSNQARAELIELSRPANTVWTSLWVSSLDAGGTNGHERGVLSWSNNADPNVAPLGSFSFQFGDFGTSGEGNVLLLSAASGFNNTATYLFFTPATNNGQNNDYLVWKGATDTVRNPQAEVPEPASLMLLGTGLAALARRRLRRA